MNSSRETDPQATASPASWRRASLQAGAESLAQWSRVTADFLSRSAALMRMSLASVKPTKPAFNGDGRGIGE